jgi:membrane-associated phospholipid phosphatase
MGLREKAAATGALVVVFTLAAVPRAIATEFDQPTPQSVYRISPLLDTTAIVAGFAVGTLPYIWSDTLVTRDCPCPASEVNAFDRRAIGNDSAVFRMLANGALAVALVGPLAVNAVVLDDHRAWLEDFVVFVEAQAINTALTTASKFAFQRPQPTVYDPGGPDETTDSMMYLSFWSGHTSAVFTAMGTAAFTVGKRYGIWAAPYVATLAFGAGTGISLILAGGHFPTDVFAGAAAGALVGTVIPWLHVRRDRRVSLLPWRLTGGAGIALRGSL